MLGLCWTPAAVQGMKKMATTMPSNSEQLVGAILVRKDIFHRFETTMSDTCLDANNLLEYLFSLYNSTASPSERDHFPSAQELGFMRRDLNHNKKGTSCVQPEFHYQNNTITSKLPLLTVQTKLSRKGHHPPVATNGHRKKIKTERPVIPEKVNILMENDYYSQPLTLKQFKSQPVFPDTIRDTPLSMKLELTPEGESMHAETTYLQPLSQIPPPISTPHSPASVQYLNTLPSSPCKDSHIILGEDVGIDPSSGVQTEGEGALPQVLETPQKTKATKRSSKHTKKSRLKGCEQLADDTGGNSVEYEGRKKRHPCFCGAMFTRADNLKRHIRKCHEEKLEKLNQTHLDFDTDNSSAQAMDFSQSIDLSDQTGVEDLPQTQDSQDYLQRPQQHQPDQQQLTQQHQPDQQQLTQQHQPDLQQLTQQHQPDQQQLTQQKVDMEKSARDLKWSCFCGENFHHHQELVEHTETHGDT